MKLTQERLKEIILEELNNLSERPAATQQNTATAGADATQQADPTKSITQLKKDLLDASKNVQNIKGLDPKEIELISATLGSVLQASSQSSAANLLQRIHDVIQKQIK